MPKPLDPEKREAIEQAIRAGGHRNAIARDHGVSGSTVTKIAKDLETRGDLTDAPPFDRSQTSIATESRQVDLAARRAELSELLLNDAFWLRQMAHEGEFPIVVGGVKNPRVIMVPPNPNDLRNLFQALAVAVDKAHVLTGATDDQARAATLLERLMESVDAR